MSWLERVRPTHLIVALACLVVGLDVLFFPFYADDFHFLDVARHRPILELLSGRYGIWPWYRPLSRELFFLLLTHVGALGPLLGHAIEAAAVALAALLIYRIATPLTSALAGAISAMLFVVYEATKLLASWASGFQDLLALVLTLAAVSAMRRARYRAALVLAALAPLAKEPAFIVYPILMLYLWLFARRGEGAPRLRAVALSALVPLALHAIARATWSNLAGVDPALSDPPDIGLILLQAVRFFVGGDATPTARGLLVAIAAAGVAWLCVRRAASLAAPPAGPSNRVLGWFACAAVLGVLPVVAGSMLVTYANAYHVMPAVPWCCMLMGAVFARAPVALVRAAVPALVGWNALSLALVPPNLDAPDAWEAPNFTWRDALRFAAVTERIGDDLRVLLADRPESLVVLFENFPPRTFLQTEDGPAVRELLGDPTLRSYWSSESPWIPDHRGVRIVTFDHSTLHLRFAAWSVPDALHRASNAIIARRGGTAAAIIRHAIPIGEAEPARTLLLTAAVLIDRGPDAYLQRLGSLGLGDSSSPRLAATARALSGDDPSLTAAQLRALRRPLTAASFIALADSFAAKGLTQGAGFSLRLAVALKPDLWPERLRLADLMLELGGGKEAMEELSMIASDPSAGSYAPRASAMLASLEAAETERIRATGSPPATP